MCRTRLGLCPDRVLGLLHLTLVMMDSKVLQRTGLAGPRASLIRLACAARNVVARLVVLVVPLHADVVLRVFRHRVRVVLLHGYVAHAPVFSGPLPGMRAFLASFVP